MLLRASVPPGNERGPQYMEQALAAICHGLGGRHPLTLLIGQFGSHLGIAIDCPPRMISVVQQQVFAHYPECELSPMAPVGEEDTVAWSMVVRLVPDIFQLKTHDQFRDLLNRTTADPLAALLAAAGSDAETPHAAWIEFCVRPVGRFELLRAKRLLRSLDRPLFHRWPEFALWYARCRRSASRVRRLAAWLLGRFLGFAGTAALHGDRSVLTAPGGGPQRSDQ